MDSMLDKIREAINFEKNDESKTFYNKIKDIVVERWNEMTTPLHPLAYALNPKFYHEIILSNTNKKEVLEGYKKAFKKLYPNAKVACDVRIEFSEFAFSLNSYGDIYALQYKKAMSPTNWWNSYGSNSKHLQTLFVYILSQVASSSSA
eukprot:Gb_00244 [translate_table: standard]